MHRSSKPSNIVSKIHLPKHLELEAVCRSGGLLVSSQLLCNLGSPPDQSTLSVVISMLLNLTSICTLFCLLLTHHIAASATVTYVFNITYTYASPDGVNRRVITVNNTWPPPTIEAMQGDQLVVKVHNSLTEATSLHWHGIHQKGSQVMDGVYQTTQCPIVPGSEYTYNFTLNQSGTYWWHAHVRASYLDGLRAPLIIHDPADPHRSLYDDDTQILALSDWYHNQSEPMLQEFMSTNNPGGVEPIPDSGLINNLGHFDCSLPTYGMTCNPTQHRYITNPLVNGRRYRIRVINTSGMATFNFSIDGHQLLVIEADGVPVTPVEVDQLEVAVAQRYSVIVTANQTASNYWIRATMNMALFDLKPELDQKIGAVLRYEGAAAVDPTEDLAAHVTPKVVLTDDMLVPVKVQDAPTTVVSSTTFGFAFMTTYDGDNRAFVFMNNAAPSSYMFPHVPTLQRLAAGLPPLPTINPINLTANAGAEIIINNLDGEPHPFHLHGHWFWIVAQGEGVVENGNFTARTKNPPLRDTVMVPANGYSVIRWNADNPGAWMFHCHVEWHLMAGLAATVIEPYPNNSFTDSLIIPSTVSDLCTTAATFVPTGNEPIREPIILPDTSKGYAGLPGSTPLLWDVSSCCSETNNGFFQILNALTGWRARPTVLTTCVYFGYWMLVGLGFVVRRMQHYRKMRRHRDEDDSEEDEYSPVLAAASPIFPESIDTSSSGVAKPNASAEATLISPLTSPLITSRASWPASHSQVTGGV
ncbi:hypothetical protein SeLEV6574_g02341 [Synchytrium endobioticum]|nr:hypothetical protein SeLEV6574_g02341 [Synchytrium endobioticum]